MKKLKSGRVSSSVIVSGSILFRFVALGVPLFSSWTIGLSLLDVVEISENFFVSHLSNP